MATKLKKKRRRKKKAPAKSARKPARKPDPKPEPKAAPEPERETARAEPVPELEAISAEPAPDLPPAVETPPPAPRLADGPIECPADRYPILPFLCRARQEKNYERCDSCPNREELEPASFCFHLTTRQTFRRVLPPGDLVRAPRTTKET